MAHDLSRVALAKDAKFTENTQVVKAGDGTAGVSGVEHGLFEAPSSNAVPQAFKNPERSLVPTFTGMAAAGLTEALQQSKLQAIAEVHSGCPNCGCTDIPGRLWSP
jgi:hypothetical protein